MKLPLPRRRKNNESRPRRQIPQRIQWVVVIAVTALIIGSGLGYEVVAGHHQLWGAIWRASAAALILTAAFYACRRLLR